MGTVKGASWEAPGDRYKEMGGAKEGSFCNPCLGELRESSGSLVEVSGHPAVGRGVRTHSCSKEHWDWWGWGCWPREGVGSSGLRMEGGGGGGVKVSGQAQPLPAVPAWAQRSPSRWIAPLLVVKRVH